MAFHRWLYRAGRPNLLAKFLNRGWAFVHSLGVAPNYLVTLEVVGRQSGKVISFPRRPWLSLRKLPPLTPFFA